MRIHDLSKHDLKRSMKIVNRRRKNERVALIRQAKQKVAEQRSRLHGDVGRLHRINPKQEETFGIVAYRSSQDDEGFFLRIPDSVLLISSKKRAFKGLRWDSSSDELRDTKYHVTIRSLSNSQLKRFIALLS